MNTTSLLRNWYNRETRPVGLAGVVWSRGRTLVSRSSWARSDLEHRSCLGSIRPYTPLLSVVSQTDVSALYYSPGQRLIGIAGKPGSVNALDVSRGEPRGANGKLAGIRESWLSLSQKTATLTISHRFIVDGTAHRVASLLFSE